MTMDIVNAKQALRRSLIERRNAIPDRDERSALICAIMIELAVFRAAHAIHCYLPIRTEVDTRPLLHAASAAGKHIAAPVVVPGAADLEHRWLIELRPNAFVRGPLGTLSPAANQPAYPGDWQLTIVPLLAFDRAGYRLGYGKGYYDRLLALSGAPAIGVAFAAQEVAEVPHEAHDIPLDMIITENAVISADRAAHTRAARGRGKPDAGA
ncbi:MAG: 5-formyltetrahydrofolate cyclo-ligase [Oscillochloris sp.]|nr:5-formyltetrahydrofolate cyclo-ligase [Oscillochloris sp.]